MVLAETIWQEKHEHWLKLAAAFYALAHNDGEPWKALPSDLRETDVGVLCEEYLQTRNEVLIGTAGQLLAGPNWYVVLGHSF
jgi:4-alpha-glucanotransferase